VSPFKAYPLQEETNIEWIGKTPAHWNVLPGRALMYESKDKNSGLRNQNYLSLMASKGVIPYEEKGDVGNKKPEDLEKCKLVRKGQFIINSMNYYIGSYGVSKYDGICSPVYLVLNHNHHKIDPAYLDLILSNPSYQKYAQSFGTGILEHRCAIGWDIIKQIPVALPPLREQREISIVIHKETAHIDSHVEEKTRFIELLTEKRQALITDAVKGKFDVRTGEPYPKYKPSGVEWLGDVPEGWDVKKIKHLTPVQRGASPRPIDDPKYFDDDGEYAWVRIADVSASDGVLNRTTQTLSKLGSSLSVKIYPGELFLSIAGTVGKPCISAINACIHDGFVYFPMLGIDPKYLFRIFETGMCYFGLGKMGTQLNLNTETVGGISIALPPTPSHIAEILECIDRETDHIDSLVEEVKKSIELLKERRSALITAAVTGKIDLREKTHDQTQ